jgi:hypothetical protein
MSEHKSQTTGCIHMKTITGPEWETIFLLDLGPAPTTAIPVAVMAEFFAAIRELVRWRGGDPATAKIIVGPERPDGALDLTVTFADGEADGLAALPDRHDQDPGQPLPGDPQAPGRAERQIQNPAADVGPPVLNRDAGRPPIV